MKKNYSIYFIKAFILALDSKLEDFYNEHTKREDFLHLFYIIDEYKNNDDKREYASFSTTYLRNQFGYIKKDSKRYWKLSLLLDICFRNNILESTGYSNFEKKYTKKYKYTDSFAESVASTNIELVQEVVSESLYNKIVKETKVPTDLNLLAQYNLIKDRLSINVNDAKCWADEEYNTGKISFNKLTNIYRNIAKLVEKTNIIVTSDEKTGRVFTDFTLMKRELRGFCNIDDTKLKSLDLKSSQPYLLASYLKLKHPTNNEVNSFYKIVTEEDIYLWIVEKWGTNEYTDYKHMRDMAKTEFMRFLFKDNRGDSVVQSIISREFPELYLIIKNEKREKNLAITLQKIEAEIFITVENKFCSEGCLSVHDSLYFKPELEQRVKTAIETEFNKINFYNYNLS